MKIQLKILGDPVAKKRPKVVRRTRKAEDGTDEIFLQAINTQTETEDNWLLEVYNDINAQLGGKLLEGPLVVKLEFICPRPKSHFGTGQNKFKMKRSAPMFPCNTRQDLDNFIKFPLDILNKRVWVDDRQIVHIIAWKLYGIDPMTRIEIATLDRMEDPKRKIG